MSLFDIFRRERRSSGSATQAKERLQILLAHERLNQDGPDYLPMLQSELLEVIRKYLEVDGEKVEVKLGRDNDVSTLEVNIELAGAREIPRSQRSDATAKTEAKADSTAS